MMTLRNQFTLQLHPIHARHLHVTDQAIGVMQAVRFQERVSGRKLDNRISQRSNELIVAWRNESSSSTIAITGTLDNLASNSIIWLL